MFISILVSSMEEALVLYPAPLVGHLFPIIELCKLILTHQPSLSIHILTTTTAPFNTNTISEYITTISATIPSIIFHNLPAVSLPPPTTLNHHETLLFEVLRLNTPHVRQALLSISKTYTIQAFIMDIFCSHALTIASQLNLPVYYFFTCSGSALSFFFYFPTIHITKDKKNFRELNTYLDIPGVPPMHTSDLPEPLLESSHQMYQTVLQSSIHAPKTAGVIVNTFEALEPRSLKAISDGLCTPNGPTPPVFCVGPLVAKNTQTHGIDECLRWLNSQPRKSVVFLCFGSMGVFSKEQLCEIACGLERSGQRFLWVVRNPPLEQTQKNIVGWSQEDPDLDSLLPEGFLDRTRERGLVVNNWVPQVAVLNNNAVGGFVSHCGWNSVVEAVCAGVPMVAWPLYAEQRFNRVVLVQEMQVALWMHECDESGFVTGIEVEERVRELMESEKGEMVRKRVMVAKDEAKAALLSEDGSSRVALTKLLKSWKS